MTTVNEPVIRNISPSSRPAISGSKALRIPWYRWGIEKRRACTIRAIVGEVNKSKLLSK